MMHTHILPTVEQIEAMQSFMDHAQPPTVKGYRAMAKSLYASLALAAQDWKYIPCIDVAWDTTELNDFYVPTIQLNNGIVVCDIRDAVVRYPAILDAYLGASQTDHRKSRKLIALVEACYNRGALVWIPPQTTSMTPIDLQLLLGGYRQNVLLEKLIVLVGDGASVAIADTIDSSHCAANTIMRSIDYVIGNNATLSVIHEQDLAPTAYDLSRVTFHCGQESQLNYTTMITGGATTKHWLDIFLQGIRSRAVVRGAYALHEEQKIDITTLQRHDEVSTTSDLMIKGVLGGSAHAYYQGTIAVGESATQSHASQDNHTLLLSNQARARAVPSLEVLTNDVNCFHGSAVGQLDEQQLFYLQSRGFTAAHARMILLEGFFADVLNHDQALKMCAKMEC